jgi:hypothetical protein
MVARRDRAGIMKCDRRGGHDLESPAMETAPAGEDRPSQHRGRRLLERASPRYAFAAAAVLLALAGVAIALRGSSARTAPGRSTATSAGAHATAPAAGGVRACGATCDPIDPRYLGDLHFGATSFWIQPWRAYLDTWPASRLLDAVGVNFNVKAAQAPAVARLLHESGYRLARIGVNWDALAYSDPTTFVHAGEISSRLMALRNAGLRPLILLDANSSDPAPSAKVTLETLAAAPAGSRKIVLSAASAAQVVAGRTGLDALALHPAAIRRRGRASRHREALTPAQRRARREARQAAATRTGLTPLVRAGNPAILITAVSAGGVATLSTALPEPLAAGPHKGSTLLYAPFASPTLPDGSANAGFQRTLHGWLSYVGTVSKLAARIFGPGGYDLEVWNELGFGSQFLEAPKYYSGTSDAEAKQVGKAVARALLAETVAYVRDPANGISPGVGITDGFASQTPFSSAASAPPGLTAFSKHLYATVKSYPVEYQARRGAIPYDALGHRDTAGAHGSAGALTPLFVPSFQSLFPEFSLTAETAGTVVRNLAPFTTTIYRAPYGRYVSRPHQPAPQVWMTEYNLGSRGAVPMGPDGVTPQTTVTVTAADKAHFDAKALLRSLVAMVNKGMTREYFYAASAGELSLVSPRFMAAVDANPTSYPGDQLGGETMDAFRAMLAHFQGPGPGPGGTRQLQLLSVAQNGNHAQFTGDSTTAHPNLYDREVLAVLPFQSSPTQFVIPVYVMTRDLLTLYEPNQPSSDTHRYDLPNETFRITLSNLPPGTPTVTAYDPLRKEDTPAHLLTQQGNTATFELAATDYPRLLTLTYPGS